MANRAPVDEEDSMLIMKYWRDWSDKILTDTVFKPKLKKKQEDNDYELLLKKILGK